MAIPETLNLQMDAAHKNAIWATPISHAIVAHFYPNWTPATWNNDVYTVFSMAQYLMQAPGKGFDEAVKTVKNLNTTEAAWDEIKSNMDYLDRNPPYQDYRVMLPTSYVNDITQKYADITNRRQNWDKGSRVGVSRGTVLTGGRGVRDQAQTQQSRLKTKLG